MRSLPLALLLAVSSVAAAQGSSAQGSSAQDGARLAPDLDRAATDAYRVGDYDTAATLWIDALSLADVASEKARLLYNLGNSAYRDGDRLEAIGWYTSALRYAPRDTDVWANLELARAEEELEPADRGDLAATLSRLLSSLTRAEAEWLLLLSLLPLAIAFAGEALRGGQMWRRLILVGLLAVIVGGTPLAWQLAKADAHPVLVVQTGGAQGRSEPRPDAKRIARLEAGSVAEWRDALPGWVKVEDESGRELWVRDRSVFDLVR